MYLLKNQMSLLKEQGLLLCPESDSPGREEPGDECNAHTGAVYKGGKNVWWSGWTG